MTDAFLDIWHGEILTAEPERQNYYALLNDEEKQKASTFLRPEMQQKYSKTRGVLRKVLASYLDVSPQKISIKMGEHGKPFVDDELFFNLSHTGNKFALAVSNCGEVGIDLEQKRDRNNLQGLVERCFSEQEANYWQALSEKQKVTMF